MSRSWAIQALLSAAGIRPFGKPRLIAAPAKNRAATVMAPATPGAGLEFYLLALRRFARPDRRFCGAVQKAPLLATFGQKWGTLSNSN